MPTASQLFFYFMEQNHFYSDEFVSALNVLIITLENCDGNGWNDLMKDLSEIRKKSIPCDSYESLAAARCSQFVSVNFWKAFPSRTGQETIYLLDNRLALIAGASAAIAFSAMTEFDIEKSAA